MLLAVLICAVELVAGSDNLVVVPLDKQYVPIYRGENVVAYKTAFFGDLFVGSSSQEFSVVFDTGSGHMFLPSIQCETESCRAHHRYNETASTSAIQFDHEGPWDGNSQRDEVAISFGTGEVIGNIVEEVVCLNNKPSGSACARLRLVTANHLTDVPFKSFHFDGVVGLGLANLAVDSRFSFFEQMVGGGGTGGIVVPQFGYFISERDDVASEICFGGHDARHMRSPLQWVPVHDPQKGFWQVKVLRVTVNGEDFPFCADGSCVAMADTGTSLIGAPRAAATSLHRLLARKVPAGSDSMDDIDCREVDGPELQFELEGGVLVSLGGREYSRAAAMKVINKQQEVQHVCRATLLPVDPSPTLGEKTFILGQPLLQKYYTVYDWEQQRVGFALAEQGSEATARHKVYGGGSFKSSTVHV
eukprot:Skav231011  [mRNA]  locus=scaffold1196:76227:77874:+ [translate_table: standard]